MGKKLLLVVLLAFPDFAGKQMSPADHTCKDKVL
jgi:hypothetical protein